ncbi:MAG: M3 family oligoendopeptidase [Cellulosilyticaceae bacterium]
MDTQWSLKELYESFECEAFQNDFQRIDGLIKAFDDLSEFITKDQENIGEKLEAYIRMWLELRDVVLQPASTPFKYVSLLLSADSNHAEAAKYKTILMQKSSQTAASFAKINLWIGQLGDLSEVICASELLKEHQFAIQEIREAQSYMLGAKEEGLLAQMRNTSSEAWETYKNQLISVHRVEMMVEGKTKSLPLTEVLNMAYESSKEVRKAAYEAELAAYPKVEEGVAAALNAIKGEVLTVCEAKGYESPLHMTLKTSRMDEETLDAMLTAMRESMPKFRGYLRRKAEMLGYSNGLPWYELYAPVVQKEMPFPYEEGKKFVIKNFRTFSDNLADFAEEAIEKSWLDVYPREGKRGGAFCSSVKRIGACRILLNYGDTLGDAVTMAHELGHGFHNRCLNPESSINTVYPMPLAETASNFCEAIVKKAAMSEVEGEDKLAILESELSDCTQTIVDIYSRFLFENAFFEKRKEGYVSVEEIKNLMLEAQKEAYGDGLDHTCLHPYMWTWKTHYYGAKNNFYNFPYAFGLLFARGLYAQYELDKEGFPEKYEVLLRETGKNTIAGVVKTAGLDVHDINFWRASLKTVEEDIEAFMELTK